MSSFDRAKLFSTNNLTEKTVTACGQTFPVYVRRIPALDLRRYHAELMSEDIDTRAAAGFEAIHKAVRNENGTPFATLDELKKFDTEAIKEFSRVFTEVNTAKLDGELGNV